MAKQLLTEKDCPFPFRPIGPASIVESVDNGITTTVVRATGVFQNYLRENSNGRIYPKSIWDRLLKEGSSFNQKLKERGVLGVIEHPEDGQTHLRYISHVVTEVRYATPQEILTSNGEIVEGDIIGTYETLPHGDGVYLAGLHRAKVSFGISSRGQGNVVERGGKKIVEDDFELETWDVVCNPSVKHARPRVTEGKEDEGDKGKNDLSEGLKKGIKEGDAQPGYDLPVETHEDLYDALTMAGFVEEGSSTMRNNNCTIISNWESYEKAPQDYIIHNGSEEMIVRTPAEVWQFVTSKDSIFERFNPGLLFKSRALRNSKKGKKKEPTTESTHPPQNAMTKYDELRSLKGGIIRLLQTETKKLKPSDKAAILEDISSNRIAIDKIISEDASLKTEGTKLLKRLQEFEDVIDAEPAPDAPPPDDAPPPPPEANPELDDVDCPLPEEAKEVLSKASDMLKDLGGDSEEAVQTAEELDALCQDNGGDVGGEDQETDFVDDIPVVESKRRAIGFVKRFRTLEAIHKATVVSAGRLLEKVREGKARNITESGARNKELREYKEAATELAEMYNRDTIALNLKLLEATDPRFFAEHASKLRGIKTLKKFNESKDALTKAPAPKRVAESQDKNKRPLNEDDKSKNKRLNESVHPALIMVNANRRK